MRKFAVICMTAAVCMSSSVSAEKIRIGLESETEPAAVVQEDELPMAASLETEEMLQYPELPTGCESVALTILLKYYGFENIDKTTIVDDYLTYSANFMEGFCGDPYIENGGGCYAPVIARAAQDFLDAQDSPLTARDITGSSREEIYRLVSEDKPVLIWTTMYLTDVEPSGIYNGYNGQEYEWEFNEHCVVLNGYDLWAGTVDVTDPLEGKVTRDAERFWEIYEEMGRMAVVIE